MPDGCAWEGQVIWLLVGVYVGVVLAVTLWWVRMMGEKP